MKSLRGALGVIAVSAVALLGAGCAAPPPKPVSQDTLVQKTAIVESINLPSRLVTLRGEEGGGFTVVVDPAVRNLDQVKEGDKVVVSFYESLGAQVRKAGEGAKGVETEVITARAPQGDRPGAGAGVTVRTVVTIDSVDTSFNTVTFTRSDGIRRIVAVQTPEGRQFIRGLRQGDRVELTYTEAVAVEVRPAP